MANIYNFGLAGVANQVQFGKGGTQLLSNSGTFQAVAADGSTLVRFQIADPVASHDAVTLEVLQNAGQTINANVATLTTEVRGVETGAGLTSGTGAYVACAAATYINTATSLFNADTLLDAAINGVQFQVSNIENAVGLTSTGSYVVPTGTTFLGNTTSIMSALEALDNAANSGGAGLANAVSTLTNAINTVQSNVTTNYNTEQTDIANTNANVASNFATLNNSINIVNSNVVSNVAAIQAEITDTNANVVTVNSNVVSGFATINTLITNNYNTEQADIASTNANLAANVTSLTTAINVVGSALISDVAMLTANIAVVNANVINNYNTEQADVASLAANLASNVFTLQTNINTVSSNVAAEVVRAEGAELNLSNAINAEVARAESAELVLTNAVTAIDLTYVKKDGSVPFTGNVSMGFYNIQNVASPVANTDAVNLGYLTMAIQNLGSAFNYVGTLSDAGAAANAATDLSGLTGPGSAALAAGDYWKSTVAGWYTANAAANSIAFFVQANDGIVFNTTGGFDVIAHVDSQVFGTPGQVDVAGSVDTGFTVSLDSFVLDEISTLQGNVVQLANAISTETTRAVAAETQLQSNIAAAIAQEVIDISATNANVVSEISRANAAEAQLNSNIATEVTRAITAEAQLNSNIATEVTRAMTAEANIAANVAANFSTEQADITSTNANVATIDTSVGLTTAGSYIVPVGTAYLGATTTVMGAIIALDMAANAAATAGAGNLANVTNAIATLNSNVISNVATLQTDIANVVGNVINNYMTEQNDIANLAANLAANVTTLTTLINTNEANTVANAIQLSNAITAIENAVGLNSDGTYAPFTTSNFMNNATTITGALTNLDNELETVLVTLDTLSQYQIITSDSKAFVRVDDANGVTTALDINGAAQPVMNVVGSTNTNTTLTMDFSVANVVSFVANGTGTNVDIRLEPKGSGQVYVGQAGVAGQMQAEPGQSLEIAGGDNTSGAGGNLILRGGLGSSDPTNSGAVQITDAAGNNVATFSGVANTNTFLSLLNGIGSSTIGVQSTASSANLVLTPKGTGSVSVSGALIQNVQTGIASTDAVNVGQLNGAIAQAVTATQTGIVYTTSVSITETNGAVAIGAAISGTIIRARVFIGSAWNSATVVTVGSTSGGSDLMNSSMIDGTLAGQAFVSDVSTAVTAQTLYATVASAGGSSGTATVMVEYIHG
ncbi:unnamed protein product [Sphagnum tenellum]